MRRGKRSAGYAVLLAGTIAEILGYSAGLVPSIPGGLFEIALGILLLVKRFPAVRTPDGDGPGRPSVASGNG
ncbi:hypothetical protein [Nonomuraea sp. SYSU D8015]|uniref:hypothetical protein n=1 Tax=Nonomuraea sp. SYSU D8015 TaxID=2593644 RepID=UPI001660A40D|nr:hypothetical protein [Nonomuraea sp. SYSU D8015]